MKFWEQSKGKKKHKNNAPVEDDFPGIPRESSTDPVRPLRWTFSKSSMSPAQGDIESDEAIKRPVRSYRRSLGSIDASLIARRQSTGNLLKHSGSRAQQMLVSPSTQKLPVEPNIISEYKRLKYLSSKHELSRKQNASTNRLAELQGSGVYDKHCVFAVISGITVKLALGQRRPVDNFTGPRLTWSLRKSERIPRYASSASHFSLRVSGYSGSTRRSHKLSVTSFLADNIREAEEAIKSAPLAVRRSNLENEVEKLDSHFSSRHSSLENLIEAAESKLSFVWDEMGFSLQPLSTTSPDSLYEILTADQVQPKNDAPLVKDSQENANGITDRKDKSTDKLGLNTVKSSTSETADSVVQEMLPRVSSVNKGSKTHVTKSKSAQSITSFDELGPRQIRSDTDTEDGQKYNRLGIKESSDQVFSSGSSRESEVSSDESSEQETTDNSGSKTPTVEIEFDPNAASLKLEKRKSPDQTLETLGVTPRKGIIQRIIGYLSPRPETTPVSTNGISKQETTSHDSTPVPLKTSTSDSMAREVSWQKPGENLEQYLSGPATGVTPYLSPINTPKGVSGETVSEPGTPYASSPATPSHDKVQQKGFFRRLFGYSKSDSGAQGVSGKQEPVPKEQIVPYVKFSTYETETQPRVPDESGLRRELTQAFNSVRAPKGGTPEDSPSVTQAINTGGVERTVEDSAHSTHRAEKSKHVSKTKGEQTKSKTPKDKTLALQGPQPKTSRKERYAADDDHDNSVQVQTKSENTRHKDVTRTNVESNTTRQDYAPQRNVQTTYDPSTAKANPVVEDIVQGKDEFSRQSHVQSYSRTPASKTEHKDVSQTRLETNTSQYDPTAQKKSQTSSIQEAEHKSRVQSQMETQSVRHGPSPQIEVLSHLPSTSNAEETKSESKTTRHDSREKQTPISVNNKSMSRPQEAAGAMRTSSVTINSEGPTTGKFTHDYQQYTKPPTVSVTQNHSDRRLSDETEYFSVISTEPEPNTDHIPSPESNEGPRQMTSLENLIVASGAVEQVYSLPLTPRASNATLQQHKYPPEKTFPQNRENTSAASTSWMNQRTSSRPTSPRQVTIKENSEDTTGATHYIVTHSRNPVPSSSNSPKFKIKTPTASYAPDKMQTTAQLLTQIGYHGSQQQHGVPQTSRHPGTSTVQPSLRPQAPVNSGRDISRQPSTIITSTNTQTVQPTQSFKGYAPPNTATYSPQVSSSNKPGPTRTFMAPSPPNTVTFSPTSTSTDGPGPSRGIRPPTTASGYVTPISLPRSTHASDSEDSEFYECVTDQETLRENNGRVDKGGKRIHNKIASSVRRAFGWFFRRTKDESSDEYDDDDDDDYDDDFDDFQSAGEPSETESGVVDMTTRRGGNSRHGRDKHEE